MNYPTLDIPFLGGPGIIGWVSCIHVFISHFAVGGGIYFAVSEQIAYNNQDNKLYEFLKKHSFFFLIITAVSGAVTGVGIWWCISLFSPDGIATLIQNYTLGWACEYLFFVAELATIFVYYYSWNKISRKKHLILARYYAGFSVFTLVIINGILSFMLTPGKWLETGYWGDGFFNETYWPSLILRLLVMIAIAGMYSLVSSALIKGDDDFRTYMSRYSSKWFLPIFILGPLVGLWYFSNIPEGVVENLINGIQSSGSGNFSIMARVLYLSLIISGTTLIYAFVGPYLNPRGFSFANAILFLVCGLFVTGLGEYSREMLRKPYVVYDYMYSNGVRKKDVARINETGFFKNAKWLLPASARSDIELGRSMFKAQCSSCHSKELQGYRSIKNLLGERDYDAIEAFLKTIRETDPEKNPYTHIMPPVLGNDIEIKALARYLAQL